MSSVFHGTHSKPTRSSRKKELCEWIKYFSAFFHVFYFLTVFSFLLCSDAVVFFCSWAYLLSHALAFRCSVAWRSAIVTRNQEMCVCVCIMQANRGFLMAKINWQWINKSPSKLCTILIKIKKTSLFLWCTFYARFCRCCWLKRCFTWIIIVKLFGER